MGQTLSWHHLVELFLWWIHSWTQSHFLYRSKI